MRKITLPPEIREISLTVNFIKEGKHIIAYSPALDLSTVGKTKAHARKMFDEIVKIFFDDIVQRGVVDEVLLELGWKKSGKVIPKWVPPRIKTKGELVTV